MDAERSAQAPNPLPTYRRHTLILCAPCENGCNMMPSQVYSSMLIQLVKASSVALTSCTTCRNISSSLQHKKTTNQEISFGAAPISLGKQTFTYTPYIGNSGPNHRIFQHPRQSQCICRVDIVSKLHYLLFGKCFSKPIRNLICRTDEPDVQKLGYNLFSHKMIINFNMLCVCMENWVSREVLGANIITPQTSCSGMWNS